MIVVCIITVTILFSVTCYLLLKILDKPKHIMSFKSSKDLVGLPIVTFYKNKQKLHFLLDTGADNSAFNKESLNLIDHVLCEGSGIMTDAGGHTVEVGIAYLRFYYEDKSYEGYFQLIDMTPISKAIGLVVKGEPVEIVGVIGDDFLSKYKYVLDFEKMIAYSKI